MLSTKWGGGQMSTYEEMNERTQLLIQQSFLQLLKEKDFTKISVRDITQQATINRGTFYLHYVDKFDLLDRIEARLLQQLTVKIKKSSPSEILRIMEGNESIVPLFSVEIFEFMFENAKKILILLSPNNKSRFHLRLRTFFIDQFLLKFETDLVQNSNAEKAIPKNYLAAFAASALLGLMEEWLSSENPESPVEIASIYMKIIQFIKQV